MRVAEGPRSRTLWVGGGVVVVAAVALFLVATSQGAGLSSDSITYLHTARNLVHHHTFITRSDHLIRFIRPTQYPPLYSIALAVPGLAGSSVGGAARWLQAGAVAASAVLLALLLDRYVRRTVVVAAVAVLVLSSGFLVEINGYVLSEGLFLCFTLASLLLLLLWLDRDEGRPHDGRRLLVMAALAAAAGALTRFVGLAMLATGVVAIVSLDRRRSWRRAAFYGAIGVAPLLAWLVYSRSTGYDAVAGRQLAVHLPSVARLRVGLLNVGTWVVPARAVAQLPEALVEAIGVALLSATIAAVVLMSRRRVGATDECEDGERVAVHGSAGSRVTGVPLLSRILGVFVVAYVGEVLVTISFLDTATPLDRRLLLPVFVASLVMVTVAADRLLSASPSPARLAVAGLVLTAVLASNAVGTGRDVADARRVGLGYASAAWRHSPLVTAVDRLPSRTRVYSNADGALFQLTGRRARSVPPRVFGNGSGPNPQYRIGMATIAEQVHGGTAVVVWFRAAHHWFGTDLGPLGRLIGEPPTIRSGDGALFGSAVVAGGHRRASGSPSVTGPSGRSRLLPAPTVRGR